MGERHTLKLTPGNLMMALQGVKAAVAKGLQGKPWTLELRERTRTDDQNDALHGLIDQIIKQRPRHNGLKMDKVTYKAIFMQALPGHKMPMLPTLDGDGYFPLGLSTSKLTVGEFSELMESILAWCAREGITVEHFGGSEGASSGGESRPARAA